MNRDPETWVAKLEKNRKHTAIVVIAGPFIAFGIIVVLGLIKFSPPPALSYWIHF